MDFKLQKGISLIEVVIGVSIAGFVIVLVSHTLTLFFAASEETLDRTQALYLAEEGQEMLRYIRDSNWNTLGTDLTPGTTYYFDVTDTTIATTTTAEVIDSIYTRSFELGIVKRDSDDDIDSSGTTETGTLFATTTVSWGSNSVSLTSVLTNVHSI